MSDTGHWIMCAPVVSTAHITKQDHDILEAIKPDTGTQADVLFASIDGGWIVHLGCVDQNDLMDAGFSGQFVILLQIFFDAGYKFLRLDADGDVLNLPTSNW